MIRCFFFLALAWTAACEPRRQAFEETPRPPRIVSVDFCADQYVLKFADHEHIVGLSPDAEANFSYMRDAAKGLPKIRARAEDILLAQPDIVVRSYGGGPNAVAFFKRAGIEVVQIGYANDIEGIKQVVFDVSDALGAKEEGEAVVAEMETRLAALAKRTDAPTMLYLTSKGAVAGVGTMFDEMFVRAGYQNFQTAPGWGSAPLERLAYESPDVIAAGFFDTADLTTDLWTPARHPAAQRRLSQSPVIELPGAWTACGAWFALDAFEAIARAPAK